MIDEAAEFLIVGGYAVIVHGYPRTTGDLGIWVRPEPENAHAVLRAAASVGVDLPVDAILKLQTHQQVVRLGRPPMQVDLITSVDGCQWSAAFADRLIVDVDGLAIPVISLHHLRLSKQALGRARDVDDLEHLDEPGP